MSKYPFPVFYTQGGGLVRNLDGKYIFVESPEDFPDISVGDEIHPMWDLIPALTIGEECEECTEFSDGVDQLFEELFSQADRGEIPLSAIGSFFPSEIHEDRLDALGNFFPMRSD